MLSFQVTEVEDFGPPIHESEHDTVEDAFRALLEWMSAQEDFPLDRLRVLPNPSAIEVAMDGDAAEFRATITDADGGQLPGSEA